MDTGLVIAWSLVMFMGGFGAGCVFVLWLTRRADR